ncbi:polyprotein [Phytophthora megakarya]|uniref:Polyprotein n=1 Tax=Phytophthora megakarya TaxID=4795 RepID=A0A225W1C9_9STRA|nr:polyprotein [Phytophthora megakarya]
MWSSCQAHRSFGCERVQTEVFCVDVFETYSPVANIKTIRVVSSMVVTEGYATEQMALRTAEAKYMAPSLCTQEMIWTRVMLKVIWELPKSLASNAGYKARPKHVDTKHHFTLRNAVRAVVEVSYIPTKDHHANMLAKGLGTKHLQYMMDASGVLAKAAEH